MLIVKVVGDRFEMPEINANLIAQVILLAREMGEATQVGAHDGVRDGRAGNMAEREFRAFVSNLAEEDQFRLVAVMWIGRDSFTADEFDEAYATARQEAVNATEDYLLGIPMLADHLESGLEQLGVNPGDAEDELL